VIRSAGRKAKNAESHVRSSFLREIVPWLAMALGLLGFSVVAPHWPDLARNDPFAGLAESGHPRWAAHLVGKQLRLDELGGPEAARAMRQIVKRGGGYAVTLTCTSCMEVESFVRVLEKSRIRPVVLLYEGRQAQIPRALLNRPDVLQVIPDPSARVAPTEMYYNTPQAARFDASLTIVDSPGEHQSLEEFLRS
jgi:hypothetical protein